MQTLSPTTAHLSYQSSSVDKILYILVNTFSEQTAFRKYTIRRFVHDPLEGGKGRSKTPFQHWVSCNVSQTPNVST